MILVMSIVTALAYTIGGIFMKLSSGLSIPLPSLLVYLCFGIGASLQTIITSKTNLGTSYIVILGLESILAMLFGSVIFKETYSLLTLAGISFIVAGVAMLRVVSSQPT